MSPLPDERDLPPGRHVPLRDRLLAGIELGPNAGLRARWQVPALAAATAAGLLAVAVAVSTGRPADPIDPGQQAAGATGSPELTSTAESPTIAGLPPAEVDRLVNGCAASFGVSGYGPSRSIGPTENPEAGRNLALYNLLDDAAGRVALLYGDSVTLVCEIGGPRMPYNAGGNTGPTSMLEGAFDVDHEGASAGGEVGGGSKSVPGQPGHHVVVGRVGAEVARVTLTADGRTVEANVRNGTFIGRLVYPPTWRIPERPQRIEVHAYDALGRELPDTGAEPAWP